MYPYNYEDQFPFSEGSMVPPSGNPEDPLPPSKNVTMVQSLNGLESFVPLSVNLCTIKEDEVLGAESGKESPKSYSQSKWRQRHNARKKDIERDLISLRAQNQKLKNKIRAMGRKLKDADQPPPDLKAETGSEPLLELGSLKNLVKGKFPKPVDCLPDKSAVHQGFDEFVRDVKAKMVTSTGDQYIAYLVKVGTLLTSLSNCKSYEDVKYTMIGVAGQYVTGETVGALREIFFESDQPVQAQAGLPDIAAFSTGIKQFRGLLANLKELPLYQALEKCLILLCLGGLKPSNWVLDGSSLHGVFSSWEESVGKTTGPMDLVDVVSGVVEFCTDIVVGLQHGTLRQKLLPASAFTRYARVSSLYTAYTRGQLVDHDLTPYQFIVELEGFTAELERMVNNRSLTPAMRALYTRYLQDCTIWRSDILSREKFCDLRPQCPVFLFYGDSQVGKSEVMDHIIHCVGKACGFPTETRNIYEFNEDDDYLSGYDNEVTTVRMDDLDNRRKKDGDMLGIQYVLRFSNNQPHLTLQPEADKKGRIFADPKLVVGSGNTDDFGARKASNRPVSLTNRFTGLFEIAVMPEFADEEGRVNRELTLYDEDGFPIIHQIGKEYKFVEHKNSNGKPQGIRKVYIDKDWVKLSTIVKRCVDRSKKMKEQQDNYISHLKNARKLPVCPRCNMLDHPDWCQCPSRRRFNVTAEAGAREIISRFTGTDSFLTGFGGSLLQLSQLLKYVPYIGKGKFVNVLEMGAMMIAKWFFLLLYHGRANLPVFFTQWAITAYTFTAGALIWQHCTDTWCLRAIGLLLVWLYWFLSGLRRYVEYSLTDQIRNCTKYSDVRAFIGGAGLVALSLAFCHSLKIFGMLFQPSAEERTREARQRRFFPDSESEEIELGEFNEVIINLPDTLDAQGNIVPRNMQDVHERAGERNDWLQVHIDPPPVAHNVATMTFDQAVNVITRNLLRFDFPLALENEFGSMFAVETDVVMAPRHAMRGNFSKRKVIIHRNSDTRSWFQSYLVNEQPILNDEDEETDYSVYQITRAPPFQSMLKFLPDEVVRVPKPCKMIKKDRNCEITVSDLTRYEPEQGVETSAYKGLGSYHKFSEPFTEHGDCMSPMVSASGAPVILGFHMGGDKRGVTASFPVCRRWVEKAIAKFPGPDILVPETGTESKPGEVYIPKASLEELSMQSFGSDLFADLEPPHDRAAVRFLRKEPHGLADHPPCLNIYGEDKSKIVRPRSTVLRTVLSPHLVALGNECKWGPPRMNSGKAHAQYFEKATQGANQIDPMLLFRAQTDYVEGIVTTLRMIDYPAPELLTIDQALNGVEGKRYLRRIDETSAAGMGLSGKKVDHLKVFFKEHNGEKYFEAEPYLIDEIRRIIGCWRRGVMSCPMSKTCSKDEPTLLPEYAGKEKRRLYNVYPMAFILAQKMVFGDLREALYAIPTVSEMYQGCNFITNECEQIYTALTRCGKERMLEGDFSKFDCSLSGQLLRAGGACMISIARGIGADDDLCTLMESAIQDVAISFMCANGTVVGIDFWNGSGHFITVDENGVPNSLVHRCGYYAGLQEQCIKQRIAPDDPKLTDLQNFRKHVAFGSVGDDCTASTDQPWYNMVYLEQYFASIGLKYTSAGDKDAAIVPFFNAEQVSFCKRKFRWEERGHTWVAPLALDSIYKSLHCYMASTTPELEIVTGNVHDALLSLARHDRETFDKERNVIVQACRNAGILGGVKRWEWTYDDWWYKYIKPSLSKDPSEVPDSTG